MKIILSDEAKKTLSKLDKPIARRIRDYIRTISMLDDPYSRGKKLTGNYAGYYRYRVGDYRIVCRIEQKVLLITVVKIGHRRDIYDD